jgi:hypothetical protein
MCCPFVAVWGHTVGFFFVQLHLLQEGLAFLGSGFESELGSQNDCETVHTLLYVSVLVTLP